MKSVPAWVKYSLLRILTIAVPLAILLILQVNWVIATIAAVVIGLCVSYIFLRKPREATSRELYEISVRKRTPVTIDDDIEDAEIDRASAEAETSEPEVEGESGADRKTVGKADNPGQL